MPSPSSSLDDLRREIDRIDDSIHDLLMRRAAIVEQVGLAKKSTDAQPVFLRPAREAQILRRLMARHGGAFPAGAIVRIWREMITALTSIQGPFAVAVLATDEHRGYWDVARDHFGSVVAMNAVNSPAAALRAVSEGTATVGIVPYPAEGEADAWWRFLVSADPRTPRVVARLTFGGRGNARGADRDALVVALAPHEPSGDDRSLLAIELGRDISRGRLKEQLELCGLNPTFFCTWHAKDPSGPTIHMVEVSDHVAVDDARIAALISRMNDLPVRVNVLGGYANPLNLG